MPDINDLAKLLGINSDPMDVDDIDLDLDEPTPSRKKNQKYCS